MCTSSPRQCNLRRRRKRSHSLALALCSLLLFSTLGDQPATVAVAARRLHEVGNMTAEKRIGEDCSSEDVLLYQDQTSPLPSGIPTFTVNIMNVCTTGCTIADIHLSCGWFASARLINPRVFRRLGFDDCLVNDGSGIAAGSSVSFQYANERHYPLSVASVSCNSE